MKIAIFTDDFLPKIDGIVNSTIMLSKGLADRGHKIFIICPKYRNQKKEFSYKNIEVIRFRGIPAMFYPEFKLTNIFSYKLYKRLKKEKIDIIHFQTPLTLGIQGVLISKLLKIPLVGTVHTIFGDKECLKHVKMDNKIGEKISWGILKSVYNQSDRITSPSESAKQVLLDHGLKNLKTISNGIDLKVFNNSKSKQIKEKYNPHNPLLLFIGRIAHEKNIFYLIDCISLVLKEMKNVKFLIIGDGPQMEDVRKKINTLKLDNIILVGKIPYKELLKSGIFGACDIFVTASTIETQGISTMEAQANGLVAVGIDSRGIKDLVKNNYNGFLVENNNKKAFANAIIKLLKNKELYKKMKINTLKEIKKHDINNIIKIWEKEYKDLIKTK